MEPPALNGFKSEASTLTTNPWLVTSVDEYLYYCCPVCDHKSKERQLFYDHAFTFHPVSQDSLPLTDEQSIKEETEEGESPVQPVPFLEIKTELDGGDCDDVSSNGDDDNYFDDTVDHNWETVVEKTPKKSRPPDNEEYQCYICAEQVISLKGIRSHVKNVHRRFGPSYFGPPTKECPKCGCEFSTGHVCDKDDVAVHKQKLKQEMKDAKFIQCYLCGSRFTARSAIIKHQRENHKRLNRSTYGPVRTIQCDVCKYFFKDKDSMKSHVCNFIDKCYKKGEKIHCEQCNQGFNHIDKYKYHLVTYHMGKNFSCDKCNFKAATMLQVNAHNRRVHVKNFQHVCERCGKGYMWKHALATHMATCDPARAETHVCEVCGKHLKSAHSLVSHKNEEHFAHFMCTLCDLVTTSQKSLVQHVLANHSLQCNVEKMFMCTLCTETFASDNDLDKHYGDSHEQGQDFECCDCSESFHSKTTLKLHLLAYHAKASKALGPRNSASQAWNIILDNKPVVNYYSDNKKGCKCDICGRVCGGPGNLMEHKRQVHDKSNHIKCDYCDYSSFQPAMLRSHYKKTHDKTNTYKCDQCPFKCHYKPFLSRHVKRVHEKIKPYKCDVCSEDFSTRQARRKHMWKIHNVVILKSAQDT